jgi:hypothetical protein
MYVIPLNNLGESRAVAEQFKVVVICVGIPLTMCVSVVAPTITLDSPEVFSKDVLT